MNDEHDEDAVASNIDAAGPMSEHTSAYAVRSQITLPLSDASDQNDLEFVVARPEFGNQLGRFIAQEQIACGGMGVIVRARDTNFCRDVACKLLLRRHASNPRLVERFLLEARVNANLQHPGIVPVYELGCLNDGRPFFAMKLIAGKTLQSLLLNESNYTSQHLKIFERVCQTLAYCHSKGVMHLDLKPANVMVGAFGEVHLMDWGLARICGSAESGTGGINFNPDDSLEPSPSGVREAKPNGYVGGTPSYMAPEQARGNMVSLQSDVFGLGAILCEILTGEPVYVGSNQRTILMKAAKANLDTVHRKLELQGRDKPMVRLAQRCLAVSPNDRPADASAVAAEVTAYLESLLQEGMKDWHRFFEISLDLFCIASFEGFFLRVNGNFSRVLGYSESQLISQPFLDFVHPDDVAPTIAVMSLLSEGKPVMRFRNRYRNATGDYRTLEWSAKSVREERIIFAVARDVTDTH